MKDTNVLSKHQLNSAANSTDSTDFSASEREIPLLVSLWTRDAAPIAGLLPFLQAYPGSVILHLPAPRYESVTLSIQEAARNIGRIAASGRLTLWSGGWCGAALSLLTAAEGEWEFRWSLTNETDSGLEQLFGTTVHGFFPAAATAAQAEHLARSRDMDVIGGYRSRRPATEAIRELLIFTCGEWRQRRVLQVTCQQVGNTRLGQTGKDGNQAELVHVVVGQQEIAAGCPLLTNPGESARWLDQKVRIVALPGVSSNGEAVTPPPGVFHGVGMEDLAATLFLKAPGGIRRRSDTLHLSSGVAPILTALSLLEAESTRSHPRDLRIPDFQGTTDGYFSIEAPLGLSAVTIAGRPLQIRTGSGTGALQRRAGGYLHRAASVPDITYLTTRGATWYAGPHHRGVVEYADLGNAAALQLGTLTIDHKRALYFPWVLTLSPDNESSRVGTAAMRVLSFTLDGVAAEEPLELQTYTFEGVGTTVVVPPGSGGTIVTAAVLRVPVGGGETLLVGGADSGNRVILPWLFERVPGETEFSLTVIYAADDHQGDAAGCSLSGTFAICAGDTPLEELHLDYVAAELLAPFNRTVPEKTGGSSTPV